MIESHDTQNNGNSLATSSGVLKILQQTTLMFEESSFPDKMILTTKHRKRAITNHGVFMKFHELIGIKD